MAEKHEQTVISDDMNFRGTIETDHAVTIEGKISGNLITRGRVHIVQEATVQANISARDVEIEGQLQGNVLHADSVVLHASANMKGDISCSQLEIQRGAKHTGTTVMK
jgi:cytoskeletal protein CcmA (bactofilin family)